MKIGILTFHRAINYGAVLQCYGLSETLKALGHTVEVIDYRPEFIEKYRRAMPWFDITHAHGLVRKAKLFVGNLRGIKGRKDANRRFDSFLNDSFSFSPVVYTPETMPQDYDIIFFGSDQIWSPQICFGFDPIYWGQFKCGKTKLRTYAASLGGHNKLAEKEWKQVGGYLKAFDMLSVREKQLQKDIKDRLNIESELVVDPTLLVDEQVFQKVAIRPKDAPDNYVLVFSVAPTDNLMGLAEKVAQQTNSEIRVLSAHPSKSEVAVAPTVEEFLGWFKYARCIVTVSFHGTVFSLLFRKDFYSLENYMQDRAEQLLDSVGLSDRLVPSSDDFIRTFSFKTVDYNGFDEKLEAIKRASQDYIKKATI